MELQSMRTVFLLVSFQPLSVTLDLCFCEIPLEEWVVVGGKKDGKGVWVTDLPTTRQLTIPVWLHWVVPSFIPLFETRRSRKVTSIGSHYPR